MPIYVQKCENGHENYDEPQTCQCGAPARRKIVATMISCDMQPWDYYESPVSGKPITSYKQRRDDMARHDCVDYDPGMKDVQKKRIKSADEALEKKMDETIDKEWEKMPSNKKEKLANELTSGAEIELERR